MLPLYICWLLEDDFSFKFELNYHRGYPAKVFEVDFENGWFTCGVGLVFLNKISKKDDFKTSGLMFCEYSK